MIVSIHQPNFLPWLGFFNKIINSDVFIILDNVQFSKSSVTHRNKVKYADGEAKWLTTIIDHSASPSININDLKLSTADNFRKKHLAVLQSNYAKAPFFKEIMEQVVNVYEKKHELLADFNIELIFMILNYLNINKKIFKASEIKLEEDIIKNDRNLELVKYVGGSIYLSGNGARSYNNEELYHANNIEIRYNNFIHPEYPQINGPFISNLSVIDLLFNCGKESINYIKN